MSTLRYDVGDKVCIFDKVKYSGICNLKCGEIKQVYEKSLQFLYGIKIEGMTNPSSDKGIYWFSSESIKLYTSAKNESEENIMIKDFKVAYISFLDSSTNRTYPYALYDPYEVGETVVVHTGHHGFALAKIMDISTKEEDVNKVHCGREVVCLVSFASYEARQATLKRIAELKSEMDAKLREVQTLALYEMFAERDPDLNAMLEEYKALSSRIK